MVVDFIVVFFSIQVSFCELLCLILGTVVSWFRWRHPVVQATPLLESDTSLVFCVLRPGCWRHSK